MAHVMTNVTNLVLAEPKRGHDLLHQVQHPPDLAADLAGQAEDVGVVLRGQKQGFVHDETKTKCRMCRRCGRRPAGAEAGVCA
jgi:hypothetical protein